MLSAAKHFAKRTHLDEDAGSDERFLFIFETNCMENIVALASMHFKNTKNVHNGYESEPFGRFERSTVAESCLW